MAPTSPFVNRWRALALAAVIFTSAALALSWVYLVPIYQAPDEPMNLDYALAINEHGGLFRVHRTSYEQLPTSVHPHTLYLANRLETGAIAFKPWARMQPEYGTWDFFATVDREAPRRDSVPITGPNKPFAVYPYGYYGLLACWIGVLHLIHDGPVFVFFGARVFSVLLLCITLLCVDATLRRLSIKPWKALLVTAAVGWFPLTSFVAGAVQMDNLSFTLVSLCFYLSLVARDHPTDGRVFALLGLALGALLVTKIHFYLCVAVPIYLMLATRMHFARATLSQWIGHALSLTMPAALLGSLYVYLTWGTNNFYFPPANQQDWLTHHIDWFKAAILDYYAGSTHESFWGRFGWMDTPLSIRGARTTGAVMFAVQAATWIMLALTLLRMEQVACRLWTVARSGRTASALRMLCSNPLLNSYFLFTVFMVLLYMRVSNRFGAQGRNWLPLLLPIFLTGLVYAPKALSLSRCRKLFATFALAGLLCFCVIGSYYSLHTIQKRYYHPNHSPLAYVLGRHPQETPGP